jgi:hypothetical protein
MANAREGRGVSFETVCHLARALPGVVESTSYGTPALKADRTLFARLKEDGETLVLRMDITNRDLLLSAEPELFYLTDHYRDYPWILLRLSKVGTQRMAELLEDAWRLAASRRRVASFDARKTAR